MTCRKHGRLVGKYWDRSESGFYLSVWNAAGAAGHPGVILRVFMEFAPRADMLPALRSATAEAHQQLEDTVAIERRVADPLQYRLLLQMFLGFYRPLEFHLAALSGWSDARLDFPARRKTPWLVADLLTLGLTPAQIDALPDCADLPPSGSLASGFGCLYVLEGATLGGRHITAMLHDSPVPADARHYFNSYGAETGARWREFLAALDDYAVSSPEADSAELIRAARETFACLRAWCMRVWRAHEHPS